MKKEAGISGQREMEREARNKFFFTWMGGMPFSSAKGNMRTVNCFFQRYIICSLEVNRNTWKNAKE